MISKSEITFFSPTENKMLKILGKKKMSIAEISDKMYEGITKKPMNASIIVSGLISRINKKTEYYELKWFLDGSGQGRAGRTVWVEESK